MRFWFRDRERRTQELEQELQNHLEMSARERVERGESGTEAKYAARREFGNFAAVEQITRDQWGWMWLEDLLQDLRYGARMLRKNLAFSLVAVITLALGIGANTAIFSVVNAVLLKPLAMQDPARVVYLQEQWRGLPGSSSVGNFEEIRRQAGSFAKLGASNNASFNLATQDAPERIDGELATVDYFATFKVQPLLGRVFTG